MAKMKPAKVRKVGRPRKYEGSLAERQKQSRMHYEEKNAKAKKLVKNVSLDQECLDLLHKAQAMIRKTLPESIRNDIKLSHKDVLKIAINEYVKGLSNENKR